MNLSKSSQCFAILCFVLLSIFVYFDLASIFHTSGFVVPISTPQIIPHPKYQQRFYGSGKEYETAEWMKKKEKSYLETNERIKEVCGRHNKSNSNEISLGQLMMDTYYKWGYCPNAKVGTTTWRDHFAKLMMTKNRPNSYNGPFVGRHRRNILNEYFNVPSKSIKELDENKRITPKSFANFLKLNHILTFSFVRHPFERLVSAYKDKKKKLHMNSFSEFIDNVLDKRMVNIHWMSFETRCNFCTIPYHVIGRMENFNEDVKYIVLKNNLTKVLPVETTIDHKAHFSRETLNKDKEKESLRYFSKLSKDQIQLLYEKYRIDFEMFSYDASAYLQLP